MKALSNVSAITHSVGNILRRVVIMLTSMIVFGTPMRPVAAAGAALSVAGSCGYALAKHQEKLAARQASADAEVARKVQDALLLPLPLPKLSGVRAAEA